MKNLFAFLVASLLALPAFCQVETGRNTHDLSGRIVSQSGEPLPSRLIILANPKNQVQKSGLTDSTGKFTFSNILPGAYYVGTMNSKNAVIKLKSIDLNDTVRQVNLGDLVFATEVHELQEVVVKEDRPYIQRRLDKLVINVDANSLLAGNTLSELLPKLPGISLNQNNQLVVNGKSSVLVLVDGKGQYVSQEQLSVMLNNMKAESIDKIEIISNPSVKYDANGGAVINIITKKNSMTSDVHTTFGQQISPVTGISGKNEPNYSVGTNLNYLIGKVKTFASVDYIYDKEFQGNDNSLQYSSPVLNRNNLFYTNSKASILNTRFGFNADLSKTTSFDGTFAFYIPLLNEYNREYNQTYTSTSSVPDSIIKGNAYDRNYNNRNSTVNLRLIQQLNASKNEEIDFYFDFNDFNYLDRYNLQNSYLISGNPYQNELYNADHNYFVRIYSFKTDYTIKTGKKSRLEAGGKISFIHNTEDFDYQDAINSALFLDSTRFSYKEVVSAAYVNFVGSSSFFDYQFGGRLENTSSSGYAPLLDQRLSRNYINFFPAFTVQHNFKSKVRQQIALSFNRRIIRPGYGDFNPNTNLINRFVSRTGAPALNPQFINNFELSYNIASFNISAYDAIQNNIKALIPQSSDQALVEQDKILSYSRSNDLGFNLSYPFTITKWWSTYSTFSGSYTSSKLLDNSNLDFFSYRFSESSSFSIDKDNKIDVRFFYQPQTQFNYGYMLRVNNLSAGYRLNLLQNKLALSLNVNDILGDNKLSTITNYPGVSTSNISLRNNRTYSLTLRYNFASGNKFALRYKNSKNDKSEIRLN